jgi:VWFA-related protein
MPQTTPLHHGGHRGADLLRSCHSATRELAGCFRRNQRRQTDRVGLAVLTLVGLSFWVSPNAAQGPPSTPPPARSGVTFRSGTRLIVETVTVKDKEGKVIEGLTAKDFTVTEDGEPQTISFVEFQRVDATPGPVQAVAPAPAPVTSNIPAIAIPQISSSPPGDIRYRDRRLLVLYFDVTALPPSDLVRACAAARKFIDTQMGASDLVAMMTFKGGAVRVKHDFTDNRGELRDVIQDLIFGEDKDGDGIPDTEPGTAFGQDDGEFSIFNTDRQLSALQTAVSMLRPLAEQKSLIYFASGLRLNGTDNQAQLRATVNAAIRANVTIHTIDARGLVAQAPLGDATRPSPGGIGMFNGQFANAAMTNVQRSQDSLYALAKDTGGKALFDYNDLSVGIVQAAESLSSYYLIGYYSTHTATDGRFRRVKVTLNGRLPADVSYRQGYFADKTFAKFTAADKERQLEDALMLENPVTDITIAMEVNYFQLNRAQYFVPIAVKIPGSELALARHGGAQRTVIDFIGEVKDDYGYTIQNVRVKLDIKLSDETAVQLAKRPIQYETGFTLLPGKYVIKFLARDEETGRIGTYQTAFTVPNLAREEQRIPISSVVLSSQRVPISDALHSVQRKIAAESVNPLVYDGQKLLPSVTRVFSKSRDLYVFLQAYERGATTTQPLVAFVSFYRGDVKAFDTSPLAVTDGLDAKTKAVPLRFSIPLESVPPGRYDCQVSVLDPSGQKVAFWRAPVVVVP